MFSEVYTNFGSFAALEHKFGLVYTLLNRSFTIVSDLSKFHFAIETLATIENTSQKCSSNKIC